MRYVWMLLGAGAVVGLDQWTKAWTVQNIAPGEILPVWDGVFHLTYIRNSGMAFSLLEGARWLFLLGTLAALALFAAAVVKKWLTHPLALSAAVMICGGGVGNLIDRVTAGSVVDMIELEFMRFAVFNVADCFVTVGAVLLVVWALFLERKKPESAKEASPHDSPL